MKLVFRILLLVSVAAVAALGQISRFEHIIVVVQENRSPDNLFYALCAKFPCSTNPNNQQYNIQTANWLDNTSSTGVTQPTGVALANGYDLSHGHPGWKNQCDLNTSTQQCRMDGAASNHINRGAFVFVINAPDAKHPQGIIASYLTLATQYGWANFMFQTNQGPSFPSHQFIFGGTSALDPISDQMGIFLSENFDGASGCYAQDGERNRLIGPNGHETFFTIDYATGKTACSTRPTMADLLDGKGISWKYYSVKGAGTDGGGSLWTAPAAIEPICKPDALHQSCTGAEWAKHVDLNSAHVLSDLGMNGSPCNLPAVSWVIPTGVNSDHPGTARDGGPDWVATVVNALGTSPCTDTINNRPVSYWKDTAVIITW
ncbi:MAG TPA: alkaline phosphatase family protein, partial [Terriglobales bacterium]|nr:alkaline phosphatase family protein [Terriglobales bacterium]